MPPPSPPPPPRALPSWFRSQSKRFEEQQNSWQSTVTPLLSFFPLSPLISLLRKLRLTIFPVTFPKKFKNLKNDSWRNSNGHFPSRVEIEHYLSEERKKEKEREREREREKRRREMRLRRRREDSPVEDVLALPISQVLESQRALVASFGLKDLEVRRFSFSFSHTK